MKKVLITSRSFGEVSDEPLKILEDAGFEVDFYNHKFEEIEFNRRLSSCDALIIGAHTLSEEAIKGAAKLKIVSKHGAGLDNIDLKIMVKYGICVTNVPAVNSNAVADLTFSLILDIARKTSFASRGVKNREWSKIIGVDVFKKNISLIGFGEIGKNVARRARGFSMNVFVYDPYISKLPNEFSEYAKLVSFEEALSVADFLSVHVPLNNETRNLIGCEELSKMKTGSFIINTSRGGIINEYDLAQYISNGHIAGAGLDVIEEEPIQGKNALIDLDNVTITPHMGMYSREAINQVSLIAAKNVINYFSNTSEA
jgi:D-3-phosphoglycerate dehydrogenase